MKNNFQTILTDFHSIPITPVSQKDSCELLMKGMVKALAVKKGETEGSEVEKIEKKIRLKFKLYALSEEVIKQRFLVIWPENIKYFDDIKIIENGQFAKINLSIPLFEDLAKNHINPDGINLNKRMEMYRSISEQKIEELYNGELHQKPDHIIHLTSSGYIQPNPIDIYISKKKWHDVHVTNFYNKACNAPISAIETAHALIRSSMLDNCENLKKRIDIVHTEIFSIHMSISNDDPVNIGLITAFSDSFIKYSVSSCRNGHKKESHGLKILSFRHTLIPDSLDHAVLTVSSPAFKYIIDPSRYLKKIKGSIRLFVDEFFCKIGLKFNEIKNDLIYLIQPSSNQIITQIGKELELSDEQLSISRENLYENGYLTSSSIPFMCKKIYESSDVMRGQKIFCLGFASGITISGMLLEKL